MDQVISNNQAQFDRVCDKMKRLLVKKQRLKQNQPSQIINGLFIGNYASAIDKKFISSNNIQFIITCLKINDKDKLPGVQYKQLLIKDKPQQKICLKFDEFSNLVQQFISNRPQGKCLVNCFSGKSRSSTLVLAYLIKEKNMTFQEAFSFLKQKYSVAQPNSGFITQLKQYHIQRKQQSLKKVSEEKQSPDLTTQKEQEKVLQKKEQNIVNQQNMNIVQKEQQKLKNDQTENENISKEENKSSANNQRQSQNKQFQKRQNNQDNIKQTQNDQINIQNMSKIDQNSDSKQVETTKPQMEVQNKEQMANGKQSKQENQQNEVEQKDNSDHPGQQSQGRLRKKKKNKKKK